MQIDSGYQNFIGTVQNNIDSLLQQVRSQFAAASANNPDAPFPAAGTPASIDSIMEALQALGYTDITREQASFLRVAYKGDDGAELTVEDVVGAMIADGFLTGTPSESGVTWAQDYSAIDGQRLADAIFFQADTPNAPVGESLNAQQLDFALELLTGTSSTGLPDDLALDIIAAAGTDGAITKDQLAAFLNTGAVDFDAVAGQDAVVVTSTGPNLAGAPTGTVPGFLLGYDANGDGGLDATELQTALNANAYQGQATDLASVQMLVDLYGSDVNGTTLITGFGVNEMTTDGALQQLPNTGGGAGFAVDLTAVDPARITTFLLKSDTNGDTELDTFELSNALSANPAAGERVDLGLAGRLIQIYGGADGGVGVAALTNMLADGALAVGQGPVGNQTGGFHTDLAAVSDESIVDAVFRAVGKDPATDTLTGAEFEQGLDLVTGYEPFETPEQAAYLAQLRGTDDGTGNFTLTRDEAVSVFTSGALTRAHNDAIDGTSYIFFNANFDHTVPVHRNLSFWDTALKDVEGGADAVVSTIASITGKSEAFVADLLNGNLSFEQAIEQGGENFLNDIAAFVKTGSAEALALVDKLGDAIKTGIEGLSDNAKAYVDLITEDAKTGTEDFAVHLLATISGMSTEDAKVALESAADKLFTTDQLSALTLDEMKALIPNFDELYAQGLAAQEEFLAALPDTTEGRALLAEAGYTVDESGRVLHAETGREMTEEGKKIFYSQYARVDVAVELNSGIVEGSVLDGLQGRLFFTMPRYDAEGNEFIEFRVRELDEAGVDYSGPNGSADAGLVAVRDLVIPFYTSGPNENDRGDVRYQSSLGVIAEGSFNLNALVSVIPGLEGYVQDAPLAGAVPSVPNYLLRKVDVEFGGGAGFTVVHNLSQMDPSDRWKPFIGEFFGGAAGAATAVGSMALAEILSVGGATEYIAKYGLVTGHASAMLGAFAADLTLAKTTETSSVSSGAFAWVAGRLGSPTLNAGPAWAQLRARLQFNIGLDLWKTW